MEVQSTPVQATAVYSSVLERLPLVLPVTIVGSVDAWLTQLDASMQATVKQQIKAALAFGEHNPRTRFLALFCVQAVLLATDIAFTREVEACLSQGGHALLQKARRRVSQSVDQIMREVSFSFVVIIYVVCSDSLSL